MLTVGEKVYDTATWQVLAVTAGSFAAFAAAAPVLVTATKAGTVNVWDTARG